MKTLISLLVCLVWLAFFATRIVDAGLILDSFQVLNWDRVTEPGTSGVVTFRVTSDQVLPNDNQLNAFSVGLRIVPQAGAKGSLAIHSVVVPAANPVFAAYAAPPALKDGGGGVQTISGDNAAFANVTIPASSLGLFQAKFFSPGNDALGRFDVYADRDTTNFFTTTEFDGLKFSNVQAVGDPQGVLLGFIQVSAVPEPTSISLVTASLLAWRLVRRRPRHRPRPCQT